MSLALIVSVGIALDRYVLRPDYLFSQEVWCDPETEENCFYFICENDWWTPCTGDPAYDIWIYKLVQKPVQNVDQSLFAEPCVPGETTEEESCPEISCEEGEEDCATIYCDPSAGEDCYVGDAVTFVEEEWIRRLADVGLEPVAPEEEEMIEEDAAMDEDMGEEELAPEEGVVEEEVVER